MDLHLAGKRAFVAGSSRGLGYAVAEGLAAEGCKVAINSRNSENINQAAEKLRRKTQAEIFPLAGNVGELAVADQLVEQAAQALGGLDLLVTNAGGPPSGKFESFDGRAWQENVELSLLSHVRMIRAALPYLRDSDAASVVTMTSYTVKQPLPNLVLSNSIRAATVGLTKTLALELGPEGIRFNSILPGWTMTERIQDLMGYRARNNGTTIDEEIQKLTQDIALRRVATPEEFANAVVFLLSPAASYITGVMLTVDGGAYKGTL